MASGDQTSAAQANRETQYKQVPVTCKWPSHAERVSG